MHRRLAVLAVWVSVCLVLPAAGPSAAAAAAAQTGDAAAVARLRRDVLAQLARSGARVRAAAVALDGAGVVVGLRAEAPLPPASTQKLFTAGAVLATLGPERRLRTEVRATDEAPPPPQGPAPAVPPLAPAPADPAVVRDLAVVAGGDPSLSGARLDELAGGVAAAGVRRVTGGLWVDDGRYDRARLPGGWKPRWVPEESGPLSAFAVDVNGWRRDRAYLDEPALHNGERFRQALARAGVSVEGPTSVGALPGGPGRLLAAVESARLADLVAHALRSSDNFQSELLLKELGAGAGEGSTGGGLRALGSLQDRLGVPRGASGDGSGLSAHNRHSAVGEVRWLMAMEDAAGPGVFRASLPVYCGGSGTLRTRLCGSEGARRVAAKTGTLPGVVTLAGTASTASGRTAWFSFLLSGVRSTARARAAVDQAALVLATSGA